MNLLLLLLFKIGEIKKVPKSLRESNFSHNKELTKNHLFNDYIENQHELNQFLIGKKNLSYAGCGAIAVYNVMLSLNKNLPDIIKIINNFERKGLILNGKYGISPFSIKRFLINEGFSLESTTSSKEEKIHEISQRFNNFICTAYNDRNDFSKGIHHIAITKDNNGNFVSHNPNTISNSLSDAINMATHGRGKSLFLIGIK